MIRFLVLKHPPEAREEGAKEMSGEERLPEERWRKVGMSESLRRRRSEEITTEITIAKAVLPTLL